MLIASSLWSLWSQGLKVSETVDDSANLEMLRFRSAYGVNEIATASSKPRNDGLSHQPRNDSVQNNMKKEVAALKQQPLHTTRVSSVAYSVLISLFTFFEPINA